MSEQFLGIPFTVWGVLCLAIAAAFASFWPQAKVTGDTSTFRYLLLRWGHAAVWGLLAVAALLRGLGGSGVTVVSQVSALLALVVYFAFVAALVRN